MSRSEGVAVDSALYQMFQLTKDLQAAANKALDITKELSRTFGDGAIDDEELVAKGEEEEDASGS